MHKKTYFIKNSNITEYAKQIFDISVRQMVHSISTNYINNNTPIGCNYHHYNIIIQIINIYAKRIMIINNCILPIDKHVLVKYDCC